MKCVLVIVALLALAAPAHAQLGGIGGAINKANKAIETKDELTFSEQEERKIGEDVSIKVRQRFGVVQDPAIHKYVTLVGTTLAQQTERAGLAWTFIVLDTDGVNAFASPGGFVHITRGALGLIQNESELAGVLGHEIGHVVRKHTINALRKSAAVKAGTDAAGSRNALIGRFSNLAYTNILENAYDRGDELDADKYAVQIVSKVGYSAKSLGDFLQRLDDRNKDQPAKNGLFASHPETKERITKIGQLAASAKTTATVEARYKSSVSYKPTDLTKIATVADGASGLTGSTAPAKEPEKKEEKKEEPKKGFGLSNVKPGAASSEKQSAQVSASGGARGVGPDRAAKGGGNPNPVKVSVSAAEVDTFKKGIV